MTDVAGVRRWIAAAGLAPRSATSSCRRGLGDLLPTARGPARARSRRGTAPTPASPSRARRSPSGARTARTTATASSWRRRDRRRRRRAGRARRPRAVAVGDDRAAGGAAGADGALRLQPRDRARALGGLGADAGGDPAALVAGRASTRSTRAGRRGGTRWWSRWRRRSQRATCRGGCSRRRSRRGVGDAERRPHADRAALELYIDHTAGHLMELAARHLGAEGAALPVVRDFARGAGTAALLRALPELRARGRDPLPAEVEVGGARARRARRARPGPRRRRGRVPRGGGAGAARGLAGRAGAARARRPIRRRLSARAGSRRPRRWRAPGSSGGRSAGGGEAHTASGRMARFANEFRQRQRFTGIRSMHTLCTMHAQRIC